MNEKIRELAEQAGMGYGNLSTGNGDNWIVAGKPEELEKFAELIVQECIEVVEKQKAKMSYGPTFVIADIKQHFGVKE